MSLLSRKFLSFILLGFIFVNCISGCDKDSPQDSNPSAVSCRITKAECSNRYENYKFLYDKQRIIKIEVYDPGKVLIRHLTFDYTDSKIIVNNFESNSNVSKSTTTYTLVNNIIKHGIEIQLISASNGYNSTRTNTYEYEHNNEGYLTKKTEISVQTSSNPLFTTQVDTAVIFFTYQDGNLSSKISTRAGITNTHIYEYDPNIINSLPEHYSTLTNTFNLIGNDIGIITNKPNKNAIVKRTTTKKNGKIINTDIYNYSYEMNTDGYISKTVEVGMVDNDPRVGRSLIETYEYECD